MVTYVNPPHETEIAVWGPTQSGKDWLFKAFAKELEYYNNRYPDFRFELDEQRPGQEDARLLTFKTPNTPPTPFGGESYSLQFRRIALQNDEAHMVSIHRHLIHFHNSAGAELLSFLMDPVHFEHTLVPIKRSKYLLIFLDPDFGQKSGSRRVSNNQRNANNDISDHTDEYLERAGRPGLGKDDYLEILTRLLKVLAEELNIPKRYLAICITKTDTLRRSGNNPWELLEIMFGQKIYRLLNDYRAIFDIEVFATSAAGYYENNKGEHVPNEAGGDLIVPEAWDPINCAAPFFWIFQNREIELISNNSNFLSREYNLRKYIRYPSRRNI